MMEKAKEKPFICTGCGKRFGRKADRRQHWRDTQCQKGQGTTTNDPRHPAAQKARDDDWENDLANMDVATRRDVFESVVDDDMPDGAYFAMAAEFGLEPCDLIDDDDLINN